MKSRINPLLGVLALVAMLGIQACDTAGDFDTPDKDYFLKYYGSTSRGNQKGVDMVVNADGTIVVAGESELNGQRQIFFLKVDTEGKVLTEKYFSGPTEVVKDIEPVGNDTYVILADHQTEPTNIDPILFKIRGDGVLLDSVIYGGGVGNDISKSLTVLSNGKILVSGYTDDVIDNAQSNADLGDMMIYEFDANLDVDNSWEFRIDNPGNSLDVVAKVLEGDNTLYGMAYTNSTLSVSNPNQNLVFAYFQLEPDGLSGGYYAPSGAVNSGDTEINAAMTVPAFSQGYFSTGVTKNSSGPDQLFISKLKGPLSFGDNSSVEIFTKISLDNANNLTGISCGLASVGVPGYLIVSNDLQASGKTNIWLSKLDLSGQVMWSQKFGSEQGSDVAGAVAELPDGRILVLGGVELGDNQRKVTLMKLNSQGQFLK